MENGPIEFVQFVRFLDSLGDGWPAIIVLGVLAGFVARFMTTNRREVGLLSTALLGIAGALLGVWAAKALGIALQGTGSRFLAAFAGSLVLALLGTVFRRKAPPSSDAL
jgi:uncharacterized membrane protein YeaQ/YmgE (transglycosylase-associated protein family)